MQQRKMNWFRLTTIQFSGNTFEDSSLACDPLAALVTQEVTALTTA